VNPVIKFLTGPASPVQGYHRSSSYDSNNSNRLVIVETAFEIVTHVGQDKRRGLIEQPGGRMVGDFKMQVDIDQPVLVTQKEADAAADGTMADVVVWMGDRYIVADVADLSENPLPMLRQRTYTLNRENPL
jgi:hypothetical protein